MALDLWKELLPDILQKKEGLLTKENEKDYSPFVVNRALSAYLDCILHANEMNINHDLDRKMQYDYYFHTLRAYKRPYTPWLKNVKNSDVDVVKAFFGYSDAKAREILTLINKEQLDAIKAKMTIGGR